MSMMSKSFVLSFLCCLLLSTLLSGLGVSGPRERYTPTKVKDCFPILPLPNCTDEACKGACFAKDKDTINWDCMAMNSQCWCITKCVPAAYPGY